MNHAQSLQRALVFSTFDGIDARQSLIYNCEDCACPASNDRAATSPPAAWPGDPAGTTRWSRSRQLFETELESGHHVLFNPLGQGGAVVVNRPVWQGLTGFRPAVTFDQARAAWPGRPEDFAGTFTRLAQLELITPLGQSARPHFSTSRVLTAWLHVTNACNLRCTYCYLQKTAEKMDEATGRAAVEALVRSAVTNGFRGIKLKYAGGEASLNFPLILALHDYAEKLAAGQGLALQAVILSNGVSMPGRLVEALKARRIKIMISLDGVEAGHDDQRPLLNGGPSFQFIERTITRLIEKDYPPHLSITLTRHNLEGLPAVVRFALEQNLTFSLNFFRENRFTDRSMGLDYSTPAMISALLNVFSVIKAYLPPWSVLGTVLDRGQLLQPRQRPCGVGQDYVVIDQRGRVARCHMEIEKTLGSVFNADPWRLIRQETGEVQNPPVDDKAECRSCTWRYWCSGGCPLATRNATGRFDAKSPNCAIYRAIYPEALRLEGLRLLKYGGGKTC